MLLRRPPAAPDLPEEELDRLQEAHLAYMSGLRDEGKMLANGPFDSQSDESLRGLCVMGCGVDEARDLMSRDPSVAAGRMEPDVFTWLIPEGLARFGGTKRA